MQRFDTLVASSHQLHEHVTDVIKNSVPDGSLAKRRTNVAFRMANKEVRERIENHPVAMQRLLKVVNARHKRFKHTGFVVAPFGEHLRRTPTAGQKATGVDANQYVPFSNGEFGVVCRNSRELQ